MKIFPLASISSESENDFPHGKVTSGGRSEDVPKDMLWTSHVVLYLTPIDVLCSRPEDVYYGRLWTLKYDVLRTS